jgi:hypothetical protein
MMLHVGKRATHIGIMVSRNDAHLVGRANGVNEWNHGGKFALQTNVDEITRQGHVIGALRAQILYQGGERWHVVHITATAVPVDIAGDSLSGEFQKLRPRQGPKVRIGKMGQYESHGAHRRDRCLPERMRRGGSCGQVEPRATARVKRQEQETE